jgi:hypothetical protein
MSVRPEVLNLIKAAEGAGLVGGGLVGGGLVGGGLVGGKLSKVVKAVLAELNPDYAARVEKNKKDFKKKVKDGKITMVVAGSAEAKARAAKALASRHHNIAEAEKRTKAQIRSFGSSVTPNEVQYLYNENLKMVKKEKAKAKRSEKKSESKSRSKVQSEAEEESESESEEEIVVPKKKKKSKGGKLSRKEELMKELEALVKLEVK